MLQELTESRAGNRSMYEVEETARAYPEGCDLSNNSCKETRAFYEAGGRVRYARLDRQVVA